MTDRSQGPSRLVIAATAMVLLAAIFQSRSLISSWTQDPGSAFGGYAFALWAGCICGSRFIGVACSIHRRFVGIAAILLVLATLSGISLLNHLAIAFAASSCMPRGWARWICLVAAFSWIPALGWIAHSTFGVFPGAARLLFAGISLAVCFASKHARTTQPKEAFS